MCHICCAPHCNNFHQVWSLSSYLFPTYNVNCWYLRYAVTLTFDPLTLNIYSVSAQSYSVPNFSERHLEKSVVESLKKLFPPVYCFRWGDERAGAVLSELVLGVGLSTYRTYTKFGKSQTIIGALQVCFRVLAWYLICCSVSKPEGLKSRILHFSPYVNITGEMGKYFGLSSHLPMRVIDLRYVASKSTGVKNRNEISHFFDPL